MAAKKRPEKKPGPIKNLLPGLLASALEQEQDFIVTCETDEETGTKRIHVMTGKLISPCMLGTLKNKVEIFADEGAAIVTREWTCDR